MLVAMWLHRVMFTAGQATAQLTTALQQHVFADSVKHDSTFTHSHMGNAFPLCYIGNPISHLAQAQQNKQHMKQKHRMTNTCPWCPPGLQ
jgi:hypothetical protein